MLSQCGLQSFLDARWCGESLSFQSQTRRLLRSASDTVVYELCIVLAVCVVYTSDDHSWRDFHCSLITFLSRDGFAVQFEFQSRISTAYSLQTKNSYILSITHPRTMGVTSKPLLAMICKDRKSEKVPPFKQSPARHTLTLTVQKTTDYNRTKLFTNS